MSEYKKLYEFGPDWEATRILIDRTGPNRALSFSVKFEKNGESVELKFDRPNEVDNIVELIDVEHVVVSKELGSQREYGTIRVEFLGDCWSEVFCDSVYEQGLT